MTLGELEERIVACRACPRLVAWREEVAATKRKAFLGDEYWGRPVPGFGDPAARLVVVGLAPAAHGANRTGRMFTGDRSGDWLFRSLHAAGFAGRPVSEYRDDGQVLSDCWVTAVVRCAPPANRPTVAEEEACSAWLRAELGLLPVRVVVALGAVAFRRLLRLGHSLGWGRPDIRPRFAHGSEARFPTGPALLASYHPSQQNTFTGRLTAEMLDGIFLRARDLLAGDGRNFSYGDSGNTMTTSPSGEDR